VADAVETCSAFQGEYKFQLSISLKYDDRYHSFLRAWEPLICCLNQVLER
jgi:hypothetical protein